MGDYARYLPILILMGIIAYLAGKYLLRSRRIALRRNLPIHSRQALVAKKDQEIWAWGNMKGGGEAASSYQITFELSKTGEQVCHNVGLDLFTILNVGMKGILSTQGDYFVGFEPETQQGERIACANTGHGEAKPRTDIDILCEECGKVTTFPPKVLGSVQRCSHCRASVDVELAE